MSKPHFRNKNTFAIIGGGIAGLAAAISLRKIGVEATVFEAAPEFKPTGAGITLAYNAMQAFRQIGLYEEIASTGHPVSAFEILDPGGTPLLSRTEDSFSGLTTLYSIHRSALHDVLLSHLDSSRLQKGKRLTTLSRSEHGYKLTFDDGTDYYFRYVIAADGIHSSVRKTVLPESRLRYAGYTCWRGIATANIEKHKATETWGACGRFGIVPLGNHHIYWFACKKAPVNDKNLSSFGAGGPGQLFRNYHDPVGELIAKTPDKHILRNDIYDLKPVAQFAFGDLVLIGDAAHATTPNLGQGACMAIEDAAVLSECLSKASSVSGAFRRFEIKRIKRTHAIVRRSRTMGYMAQIENPFLLPFRNALLRMIPSRLMEKQMVNMLKPEFSDR